MTTTTAAATSRCSLPAETATDPRWLVAGGFLDALSRRDFDLLAGYLDDEVRFRALTPPAQLDLTGPDAVIEKLQQWFGGDQEFAVLDAEIGQVGSRLSMRWRLRVHSGGVSRVVEQHVFVTVAKRIVIFDLLCSGFQNEGS